MEIKNEQELHAGTNKKERIMSFVDFLKYVNSKDSADNKKQKQRSKKGAIKKSSKKSEHDQEEEVKKPAIDPS